MLMNDENRAAAAATTGKPSQAKPASYRVLINVLLINCNFSFAVRATRYMIINDVEQKGKTYFGRD